MTIPSQFFLCCFLFHLCTRLTTTSCFCLTILFSGDHSGFDRVPKCFAKHLRGLQRNFLDWMLSSNQQCEITSGITSHQNKNLGTQEHLINCQYNYQRHGSNLSRSWCCHNSRHRLVYQHILSTTGRRYRNIPNNTLFWQQPVKNELLNNRTASLLSAVMTQ